MKEGHESRKLLTDKKSSKYLIGMMTILVCVVLTSTVVFLRTSKMETEKAVTKVSEFYLRELSGNVKQVFTANFSGYFNELRLALMTTKEMSHQNHQTEEELERHLERTALRGDFLYYGLVDETGKIYISDEQYKSAVLEEFLQRASFGADEITIEKRDGVDDIFIIAVGTEDMQFNGNRIVAGI